MKKNILFLILALNSLCFAEFNSARIPDSTEIRVRILDKWITPPLSAIRDKSADVQENNIGEKFQIRMEERVSDYVTIIAPQSVLDVDYVTDKGHEVIRAAVYPEGSAGSWVLYRDKKSGKAKRLQWYFNNDADVYLLFEPSPKNAVCSLYVCGSFAARGIQFALPFESLYTMSFEQVQKFTRNSIPWSKVHVVPGQYHENLQMAAVIREELSSIDYLENAAYDENNKLKNILTGKDYVLFDEEGNSFSPEKPSSLSLSGAGFLKWIVDGIVEIYTGNGTKINALLDPTVPINPVGKNGILSQSWNLTFSLDWCRNLASEALSVRSRKNYDYKTGGVDVTVQHFAGELINGSLEDSSGYITNTGYRINRIKSLLYVLAVTEPNYFYLGAIRQSSKIRTDEFVFNDSAVFFPYFDDHGSFACSVFEKGKEMKLEDFIMLHEESFVHLERIKATDDFYPYSKKSNSEFIK